MGLTGSSLRPTSNRTNVFVPVQAQFSLKARAQIATFLASDGRTVIDPDGAGPYFETPTSIVPEDLAYLP